MTDILLSENELSSFVKKCIAIISMVVVISPIKNFINFSTDKIFEYNYVSDDSYLYTHYNNQKKFTENYVEELLDKNGFKNIKVTLWYNMQDDDFTIQKILLNLNNLVIYNNSVHINKYKEITSLVCKALSVEEDIIIFNE